MVKLYSNAHSAFIHQIDPRSLMHIDGALENNFLAHLVTDETGVKLDGHTCPISLDSDHIACGVVYICKYAG